MIEESALARDVRKGEGMLVGSVHLAPCAFAEVYAS